MTVAALMIAASAVGAPDVTLVNPTSVEHGATIVITGTGFGIKSPALPVFYTDFEHGANGVIIGDGATDPSVIGAYHCEEEDGGWATYSNARVRTNSSMSGRSNYFDGGNSEWHSTIGTYISGTTDEVYFEGRVSYDPVEPNESAQVKLVRVWPGATYPNFTLGWRCPGSDGFKWETGCSSTNGITAPVKPSGSAWSHFQSYIKQGSNGAPNGITKVWKDGVLQYSSTSEITQESCADNQLYEVNFGEFVTRSPGTDPVQCPPASSGATYIYWDNLYVDKTRARVEISSSPTYGVSSLREIQIPTSWSSTSIAITANTGAFQEGASAYLFVTDSDGNVSNPQPITIGGVAQPDTTAPPIPTWTAGSYYAGDGFCYLDWNPVTDEEGGSGLAGYEVFRSDEDASNFVSVSSIVQSEWTDTYVTNGTKYFYKVRSRDNAGNTSELSAYIDLTPTGSPLTLGNPTTDHAVGLTDGH